MIKKSFIVYNSDSKEIYFYIKRQHNYKESDKKLAKYIYLIGKNNFPDRIPFNAKTAMEWVLPPGVTMISRRDLLKYIPKVQKEPKYDDLSSKNKALASEIEELKELLLEHGISENDK